MFEVLVGTEDQNCCSLYSVRAAAETSPLKRTASELGLNYFFQNPMNTPSVSA